MTAIEDRVRRTLHTVAETYVGAPAPVRARRARPWRLALGAVAVAGAVTAGVVLNQGPEYVDRIPPADFLAAGDVEGSRYWLVENDRTDSCGKPMTGVELIAEQNNVVGQEWNTVGADFGDPRIIEGERHGDVREAIACGMDTRSALAHPERAELGGIEVAGRMLVLGVVHPDVTDVRATVSGDPVTVEIHRVDGAGYFVLEAGRPGSSYTIELVGGGGVLPGSHVQKTVPGLK